MRNSVRWTMGTNLNELLDDLSHLCGELGEADLFGRRAPIVRSQLKFWSSAS